MRGGNNLKNYIMAGLIAGICSGIVSFILEIYGPYELFSTSNHMIPMNIQSIASYSMPLYTIWGIIFGIFYSIVYDYIPANGIKKGIIYGLILWGIVFIRMQILMVIHLFSQHIIPATIDGFFSIAITYGLLIGYLYKK